VQLVERHTVAVAEATEMIVTLQNGCSCAGRFRYPTSELVGRVLEFKLLLLRCDLLCIEAWPLEWSLVTGLICDDDLIHNLSLRRQQHPTSLSTLIKRHSNGVWIWDERRYV